LLGLEKIKLRSRSGLGKLAGVALCLAGVLVIAFYAGPSIRPLAHPTLQWKNFSFLLQNFEDPFFAHKLWVVSNGAWIRGTFLLLLACAAWSLWIVLLVSFFSRLSNLIINLFKKAYQTKETIRNEPEMSEQKKIVWSQPFKEVISIFIMFNFIFCIS
jgi:hypothetical protein